MHLGHSYQRHQPTGAFDAIVIGSGIGGLVSAAVLSRFGKKRVLVLERHYRLGGFTHTFTRPGYEWDVGVHYIGQVGDRGALRALFDRLSDGRIKWAPLPDVYDRVELGSRSYDFVSGTGRFIEAMGKAFPNERDAIAKYVERILLARHIQGADFNKVLERPAHDPLRRLYEATQTTTPVETSL
jgi:phytoene dehydrogenase-like protein